MKTLVMYVPVCVYKDIAASPGNQKHAQEIPDSGLQNRDPSPLPQHLSRQLRDL